MALIICGSCKKSNEKRPELTISEKKMIEILADVHLAEAVIQSLPGLKRDSMSEIYYANIYRIHGVTEEEYLTNRKAVLSEPEFADGIYEKVIEQLNKGQVEFSSDPGSRFRGSKNEEDKTNN